MRGVRRRRRRTRAVSTVISNMMMITITLSLAAILIAWSGTTYGTFAGGAQIFYAQRGQALQERFVLEDVFIITTQNQILLFVRNVGVNEINVTAIYLNGTAATNIVVSPPCVGSNGVYPIPVSTSSSTGVCEFTVNYNSSGQVIFSSLPSGSLVYIVVASQRGNRATFTVRA